jgi:hypothetical protein
MIAMIMLKKRVFTDPGMSETEMKSRGRALAVWSLIFWFGVVTSGRMLAYTYTHISYPG